MPVQTRSKDALAQAFKTPSLPSSGGSGDVPPLSRLLPTPTSLALSSGKKSVKRLHLSSTSSTTSSAPSTSSTSVTLSQSTGDSWRGRSAVTGAQKRFPHKLKPDPSSVTRFMQNMPASGVLSFQPTAQLDYLVDLERRSCCAPHTARFTAKCPVQRMHFDLILRAVLVSSPGECPMNTALTAYFLLCRYLGGETGKAKRVAGLACQEALLMACCLIAFKLVEEVDLEVEEAIAQCGLCCSPRQVLQAEGRLCAALEWRLIGPPTPEEAAHAVLDSLDTDSCLGYACKALLVQCCVDAISEHILDHKHAFSVVGASAVCLQALFSSFSGRALDAGQVWGQLDARYSIPALPPSVYNGFMKKFKSFRNK